MTFFLTLKKSTPESGQVINVTPDGLLPSENTRWPPSFLPRADHSPTHNSRVGVVNLKGDLSVISFCYLGLTSFTQGHIVRCGPVACGGGSPFLSLCYVLFQRVNSPRTIYPPHCRQSCRLPGCFLVFVVTNNIKQSSKQWYVNNTCVISSCFSLPPRCPLGVEFLKFIWGHFEIGEEKKARS